MEPCLDAHKHHLHDLLYCLLYDSFYLMYYTTNDTCAAALEAQNFPKKNDPIMGWLYTAPDKLLPKKKFSLAHPSQ
jgi:membrane-bound acyltransferase YfiQ involved in biofilm formation